MEPMTVVTVKGMDYHVPTGVLRLALVTFDQQYAGGVDVRSLARNIAHELMPARWDDPFSEERLARCILSLKGRAGAQKRRRTRDQQASLFDDLGGSHA